MDNDGPIDYGYLIEHQGTLDIGSDHYVRFLTELRGGESVGLNLIHPRPHGEGYCMGPIFWASKVSQSNQWLLHSMSPLHVKPSLSCPRCGDHGFIRDGVWCPA